jgi:hypothetical protein
MGYSAIRYDMRRQRVPRETSEDYGKPYERLHLIRRKVYKRYYLTLI